MPSGEPTEAEIIRRAIDSRMLEVHTAAVGVVEKYYPPPLQTADVRLVTKQPYTKPDGSVENEELPVLPNVKVLQYRGGGYFLHFPVSKGDHVLVIFSEVDDTQWDQTGQVSDARWLGRHSLGYGYCIPMTSPVADPIITTDPTVVNMDGGEMVFGTVLLADFLAKATVTDANFAILAAAINVIAPGAVTVPMPLVGTSKLKGE